MQDQPHRPVPAHITESLDASVRDLETGNLHDAKSVQAEASRLIADYERSHPPKAKSPRARRTRAA